MLTHEEYEFFRHHGYLVLSDIFTPNELRKYQQLYDDDRQASAHSWRGGVDTPRGGHIIPTQLVNNDPLITTPHIEPIIRKARILDAVEHLLDGPICCSEVSL